nr:hypothetical protein [Tanacetum cinerariifolium]
MSGSKRTTQGAEEGLCCLPPCTNRTPSETLLNLSGKRPPRSPPGMLLRYVTLKIPVYPEILASTQIEISEDEASPRYRLRPAVRKCAESIELRQAFANVMFVGIAKGQQQVSLGTSRAERSEVPNSGSAKEFKGCPNKEVHDPRDSWAVKDEMLLEEAIAANVSHAEKKKSVGWFAVPIWSVPPIMLDLTASLYRCLLLLLKVLRSYWRMLLHRQRHPKMMLL